MNYKLFLACLILFSSCSDYRSRPTVPITKPILSTRIFVIYDHEKSFGELFEEHFQEIEKKKAIQGVQDVLEKHYLFNNKVILYKDLLKNPMLVIDHSWIEHKITKRKDGESQYLVNSLSQPYFFVWYDKIRSEETKIYALDQTDKINDYFLIKTGIENYLSDKNNDDYSIIETPIYWEISSELKKINIPVGRRIEVEVTGMAEIMMNTKDD